MSLLANIRIPAPVCSIMDTLEDNGFSAYVVGGCVRDAILGKEPHDWDVTTSANPQELEETFRHATVDKTGLVFGTLVVIHNNERYEVTSFREDGPYEDHRHPSWTRFIREIDKDLVRRDFTMNAMAYSPKRGLVDLYGGMEDMQNGVIRCVGESEIRFGEDAFRMLRAIRFAATFDYTLSTDTTSAIHHLVPSLVEISADRFFSELMKLLVGNGVGRMLREFPDVLAVYVKEFVDMVTFEQNNSHHKYSLWEHTVRAVEYAPVNSLIRLAMLFHDVGKLKTRTTDEKGESHYRGHPEVSAEIAANFLVKRKDAPSLDKETREMILALVRYHDIDLGLNEAACTTDSSLMAKRLRQFGEEFRNEPRDFSAHLLQSLIDVHMADRAATGTRTPDVIEAWRNSLLLAYGEIMEKQMAFTRKDLAVSGIDIAGLGFKGKEIGEQMDALLNQVIEGKLENNREVLMAELNRTKG